ncbi:hypothetical protein, partial [Seinonella peptonophila]|uniref:hypothetical protein n=1 Tax=Seinonella peptonophila TaxID=112248 RepID=UPI001C31B04B
NMTFFSYLIFKVRLDVLPHLAATSNNITPFDSLCKRFFKKKYLLLQNQGSIKRQIANQHMKYRYLYQ